MARNFSGGEANSGLDGLGRKHKNRMSHAMPVGGGGLASSRLQQLKAKRSGSCAIPLGEVALGGDGVVQL
jgi:hypothetical protein